MKRKILFVITKSNWGGAQAYVYTLATAFRARGAEVAVVLGGTGEPNGTPGLLAERLEHEGIRTIFVHNFIRDFSPSRERSVLSELTTIFTHEKPDVVHLNSSKAGGIGALAARIAGVPRIVFTSHGLAYDEDRSDISRLFIWFATWITFLLAHTSITISADTYRRARRLPFCREKIRLVYSGKPQERLQSRSAARARLLPEQRKADLMWIGTIAELTHNKGLPYLIRAASLVKKRGHSFQLCIIGTGEDRAELESLIEREDMTDCVHLLGFVPNAATYLTAFDIFVLASVKEGLPYVLLEAGVARCAVVASRIPGVIDVVDDATGLLVASKQPHEIAAALETFITDPEKREQYGKALEKKVTEQFSLERMLDTMHKIYSS